MINPRDQKLEIIKQRCLQAAQVKYLCVYPPQLPRYRELREQILGPAGRSGLTRPRCARSSANHFATYVRYSQSTISAPTIDMIHPPDGSGRRGDLQMRPPSTPPTSEPTTPTTTVAQNPIEIAPG